MAGITTSPQLRESPDTANLKTGAGATDSAAAVSIANTIATVFIV
jgi:hypothetical protein